MNQNGHTFSGSDPGHAERVAYLIAGYLRRTLTEKEHDELDEWVGQSDENMKLFEELTDEQNMDQNIRAIRSFDTEKALSKIKKHLHFTPPSQQKRYRNFWVYAVAATVILLTGAFFLYKNYFQATRPETIVAEIKDLQPGGNKATLTLSDGTTLDLDSAKNGLLKNENGVEINKTSGGELFYTSGAANMDQIKYNILSTPQGGQYQVTLPDGTKAWLNAASSLKYPVAFMGNERVVELTGEGYFEVAKDAHHPFKVKLPDQDEVEVLGTHFNITCYPDEESKKITLLEGSLKVSRLPSPDSRLLTNNSRLLSPGQQAQITNNEITINASPDLDEVTAWKDGFFKFRNEKIDMIMRQVARWYNVNIEYQGKVDYHFNITGIPRDVPVSRLFNLLEMTGQVHFSIEPGKIIVKP